MNSNVQLSKSISIQQTSVVQEKVGQHICNKMNTLLAGAIALEKIATFASEHGNRGLCAGITLAAGVSCFANGNVVLGGVATFAALKEAVNIWQAANPKNDIANLLNDATAGVDMIKTLEEANSESFKLVQANLKVVHKNVEKMNDRMEKIKAISTEGQQEIEEMKGLLSEQYEETEIQFTTAKASFKLSQARYKQANTIFIRSLKQFNELFEIAQTADIGDQEKLTKFIKIAQKIQKQCEAAQQTMKEGGEHLEKGLEAFDLAQDKEREAYGQSILLMEKAKNKLELIEVQAKVKRKYEQKIEDTEKELEDIQGRNQEIKALLGELSEDLNKAKAKSADKFGTLSVILGVVPGAVVGFNAGGLMGAVVGGYGGGAAVHNRKAIVNKVDDLVNGPISFIDKNPNQAELVKVKFSSRSTGWFNRFIKKTTQSYTAGILDIRVGKDTISLPFNLNEEYKINKSKLFDLQQLLGKKVISGEIKAEECLRIISELENKLVDRGPGRKIEKGIISANSLYLSELKRVCLRIVESEQKSIEQILEDSVNRTV